GHLLPTAWGEGRKGGAAFTAFAWRLPLRKLNHPSSALRAPSPHCVGRRENLALSLSPFSPPFAGRRCPGGGDEGWRRTVSAAGGGPCCGTFCGHVRCLARRGSSVVDFSADAKHC